MVSRKHFQAFAEWVAQNDLMGTQEPFVLSFCNVLKGMNPRFDIERFITRCDELQGFERGDLSFPISQDKMPQLALNQLQLALFGATGKAKINIQECIDATLKVFPHLKEN